ncbi:Uncharacterized protein KIAA1109 [Cricetulus griseus]|uniref:Uncharacterized protein KIAA1109 n=1 Tax=Cricetulus griseus TaxID=10029 RepID=G3IBC0_CRIGR|nr:Uncharacterized protein KIAA1109 [Cricetulus griseus]
MGEGFVVMQSNDVDIYYYMDEPGYTPAIKGQLLHVDATTSMQYRTLLEAEMLAFHINASYPRIWNMPQTWQCELEVYKATYHFIFAQKNFFTELPPDKLHVEMELSPDSQITLYGPLLNAFLCIKENYFGEDDMYMDFEEVISSPVLSLSTSSSSGWTAVGMDNDKKENESSAKSIHPLALRPWDITVLVNLYKVHGRLPVHGSTDGPECPTAFLERLCFEMKKGFRETMLQLVLSPLNVFISDNYQRPPVDEVLREGHINLSGLQLRAHAMFSAEGLPLGSDSLEYAWLIDVQTGNLTAKVTAPQLSCIPGPCPTSDDLKYTMTRLAVDGADIYIVEHGCATNIKMGAVRVANCNLHNQSVGEGISAAIQDFQVRQYIEQLNNCRIGLQPAVLRRAYWLEAGSANLGLITVDIALAADHHSKHEAQRHFLETHDARTKRFFGGTVTGLDFFKLEELTPSSSSAFSSTSAESDMYYGQSLLQPGEWIITKEIPKTVDGNMNGMKRKEWENKSVGIEVERKTQHLSLQVPLRSHSSSSSSEENSSSSAAQPLLAGEKESPSSVADDHLVQKDFLHGTKRDDGQASVPTEISGTSPVSPNTQDKSVGQSPLRSPLKRQASVCSTRLGSTKSLTAAFYGDKQPVTVGVQFSSDVSRSDENVLDSPKQRRSFGSFPYTPSADSNSFHQYRSMDSSMSMADSEAYFSAAEEFEPISSDEGPGTYPGRKKKKKQMQQIDYSRGSIYHSVEGPLTVHGESITDPRTLPFKTHPSQASFVSALGGEDEVIEHLYIVEGEKTRETEQITSQQPVMSCYQTYLTQFQVINWSVKHPTNKRTSKSSLHRPLDLDTPTSEESSSSFEQLSVPTFKVIKQGLTANSLLDRGMQLSGSSSNTPYTPLDKKIVDNTDDETLTEEWTLDQPVAQTKTTAIVEVKGTVDVVLTPLVAEALDRYIEAMVHCASTRHPAAIVDDLHTKVLREAVQNSKTTFSENVNLCLLQASVEESPAAVPSRSVTHVSLVALCFDRIATQVRMNRGVVEETSNNVDPSKTSNFDRYVHASKMQPQSSGSLRSNAGAEKGKEIAAKLNIHRVHGQLRGLDTTDIGTCAITAIPFEKSKVLFTLEELDEFTFVDETDQQAIPDVTRIGPSQEKWGWIMFECGLENLTIKGGRQSGAVLYNSFGIMGKTSVTERGGVLTSNNSSDSPTGSGYNTDVSDDNLPCDRTSPSSDINGNSVSDEQSDGLPALVTLKKGLVALARQWMKFIVVTPAFKGVSLHRPAQPLKPPAAMDQEHEDGLGLDNGGGLQSDTSADGAEFEFDAATVSEHTMLLEGTANRPPPGSSGPVTGAEIMRKLSKTHTHSDSALKIKGIHPYHSLSYTSGDTATDSPVHVGRAGMPVKESPRKESLLSYLTGSFPSLHNLLEGTPQRSSAAVKSSSLTRTGNTVATDMLSEHPLLSEPSSVSFYNWMSNAVGNRGSVVQESPVTKSGHNSLPTGVAPNLPTIPSASDFNTVLSSDQNTLDGTHSQHSTSQDDVAGVEEANQGFPAVQLADAQVVFKPLLSHTGIQSQDTMPLCYRMYFGEHLSFSGTLDCLRADIVDSDTAKDRKGKRARRQGHVNLPPLEFKPALMLETFSISAVVMEKSVCTPQNSTNALSFHDLNKRYYNTFHCNFTISCQSISQHVDMALVRLIHQFSTMIDDIKATQTDIKLSRYTAGSASPTPTFKTRKHRDFRSSDFSRSSRGSLNGGNRVNNAKNKRANNENNKKESRNKNSLGRSERRTSKVSRKGSKDVVDHMTIHMDDSDSITVSEQSEPSAECWQNMYKLLNFYSLISDPTGILEKSSETFGPAGVRSPTEPTCRVVFENEQDNNSLTKTQRKRSLVTSEPQHVTLIVFGIGMVNRTHLEADIGGLTMESELKRIHGSFTLKEKMKDVLHQKMTETCATAHIGGVNIVLLEGITPNIQLEDFPTSPTSTAKQEFLTVVKCSIAKSQALYSAQRGLKTNNAAVFKVGAISINIPQHPATLHSMMVRSSHQLSKQISDLIRQPSTAPQPMKEDIATPLPSEKTPTSVNQTPIETNEFPQLPEGLEKKPIVLKFSAMLDGIAIGAALLPSLKAEYKMGRMRSHGMTGAQTRFTFELPNHRLRFTSKVSATDMSTIPPSASLNLPPVTMSGKYIMEEHDSYSDQVWSIDELPSKQGYYLQGNYLRCVAEVGSFEHNLTTDLLNHLVFVQKVFMKEVNEVIQKVSGGEQPIPLWNEHDGTADGDKPKILLYSLNLQFKVYEEAGSDFHQVAYFKTRIGLRNALREEISGSSDREAVLITLNRPIVYAQPVAFDRAVLFWLNYKAAYDNWNEQRMALHKDIHMATKEVVDMLPGIQQTSAQAFGTLFLQLTVNDLGICLPITNTAQSNHTGDLDTGSALVLTIESTLITACSSESLVSKGHFKNFCIRFADGFETSWDDWKPEIRGDLVMNACVVPDGTYEVCSRTTGQAAAESSSAGTWTLNVLWKMCGIDVHMDPNIGKRLNALGNTLTTLTGEEDIDDIADLNSVNIADLSDEDEVDTMSPTIHTEAIDYRRQGASSSQPGEPRGRKIMKRLVDIRELNEQAKVIDDLKKLGASEGTINQEIQRYQQLESVAVNDIRRDVRKKLRRSSMRAASLKDKWGLGYKPSYNRSKSISASGRPPLKRMERASSRIGETDELPEIRVDAASPGPRVTFNIQDTFPEETELDLLSVTIEGPSHYSSNSEGSCSVFSSPKTTGGFLPSVPFQSEDSRRDDSLSSTSEDSEKDEKDEDRERERFYIYRKASHTSRKKATGFAAVHQLLTERWPTTPVNRSISGPPTERNIDFELDIRVEIDSGKCVLHPTTLLQEHDDISLRR